MLTSCSSCTNGRTKLGSRWDSFKTNSTQLNVTTYLRSSATRHEPLYWMLRFLPWGQAAHCVHGSQAPYFSAKQKPDFANFGSWASSASLLSASNMCLEKAISLQTLYLEFQRLQSPALSIIQQLPRYRKTTQSFRLLGQTPNKSSRRKLGNRLKLLLILRDLGQGRRLLIPADFRKEVSYVTRKTDVGLSSVFFVGRSTCSVILRIRS